MKRLIVAAVISLAGLTGCPSDPDDPEVNAPTLSSVAPDVGPMAGGTDVVLTGTGFVDGASVFFGDVAATDVTFVSSTELDVVTPAQASGFANVRVRNPDAQEASLADGFYFNPPILVLSISSCAAVGGCLASVTAFGGYFFVQPVEIKFGAVLATVWPSPTPTNTSFVIDVPAGAAGTVDVVVTNADGSTFPDTAPFTYN